MFTGRERCSRTAIKERCESKLTEYQTKPMVMVASSTTSDPVSNANCTTKRGGGVESENYKHCAHQVTRKHVATVLAAAARS